MLQMIFDAAFYSQHHGLGKDGTLAHFRAQGDRLGLDPSPYFSTSYYKQLYPDWQRRGARTAADDFLRRSLGGEMPHPHPLIDPSYYLARYPDLAAAGVAPALHFISHGDGELRSPSAAFAADFYQSCYLALEQTHPFRHFAQIGQSLGYLAQPLPRTPAQSAAAMATALSDKSRPILLGVHDAQRAGVPLLTLDLAAALRQRDWQPIFVLDRAGPLIDRFRALGPVFILAEGWNLHGLTQALDRKTPALVNTAAAARMANAFAAAGQPCLLMIHEMAEYLRAQGLLRDLHAAQQAGARLIASMPRTAAALADALGTVAVLRPGVVLPPTPLAGFRRLQAWRKADSSPVFIAAGHADHRKGFDLFLEAAWAIRQQQPSARFIWLGALDAWARGLADTAVAGGLRLMLPGFVTDSLAWYRAADVYLLTSRQDPGPTTVIHAAAVGTPFVGYARDLGIIGMAEPLGQFIAPDDPAGFVQAALLAAQHNTQQNTPASRRGLRQFVRAETPMAAYIQAILHQISLVSAGVAV